MLTMDSILPYHGTFTVSSKFILNRRCIVGNVEYTGMIR